ncbi:MAG: universal stress protein [Syntrophales bacterium]|jgi:nucleotide-binding universal stress UspA family protein
MFEKILVPLDGSPLAATILPEVEDLAKSQKPEITLLTVSNVPSPAIMAEAGNAVIDPILRWRKSTAEAYLTETTKTLKAKGLKVSWVYREGAPASEIIRYADEARCDLIAMATHGRGEVAWVLGSVAEKVVSHATVPVLLMRVLKGQRLMKKKDLMSGP